MSHSAPFPFAKLLLRGGIGAAVVVTPMAVAGGQIPTTVRSTQIPSQIATARRVFVSNGGATTYGAESYVALTKYDGGPNRAYDELYAGLQHVDRFELVGAPSQADIVISVRFSNPTVTKQGGDLEYDPVLGYVNPGATLVHDPQITLTIVDPATRIELWSITEHVEPGRSRADDNAKFDQAIARLVADTRRLTAATSGAALPLGAAPEGGVEPAGTEEFERRFERERHFRVGMLVGGLGAMVFDVVRVSNSCQTPGCDGAGREIGQALSIDLGSVALGAIAGWFWPTRR